MTTNLVESFNAWLKIECHHSICTFMVEHIIKLSGMLVKHKEESKHWKWSIRPKIEKKLMTNITKDKGHAVSPFMNSRFGVSIGRVFVIMDLINRTCTCKACKCPKYLVTILLPLLYSPLDKMWLSLLMNGSHFQSRILFIMVSFVG